MDVGDGSAYRIIWWHIVPLKILSYQQSKGWKLPHQKDYLIEVLFSFWERV